MESGDSAEHRKMADFARPVQGQPLIECAAILRPAWWTVRVVPLGRPVCLQEGGIGI